MTVILSDCIGKIGNSDEPFKSSFSDPNMMCQSISKANNTIK